jgi:hypothetical protein
MRNPDKWQPEPEEPPIPAPRPAGQSSDEPDRRGAALVGLCVILVLVIGGLMLAHELRSMALLQDCALSGRSNCD